MLQLNKKAGGCFFTSIMKTKIKIILLLLFLNFFHESNAQTDVDAFRYSGESITGTARYSAMSGAFGALGGDFTTLSHNPAGIAIYRSSEFTFTPSIYTGSTSSNYLGQSFKDHKYNFNIGNTGLIYTNKLSQNEESQGWKSWNFGLGYNRLNNFHSRNNYEGINPSNSLIDNFVENSNGIAHGDLDRFHEFLAYDDSLTSSDSNNQYYSLIPNGHEMQNKTTESTGSIGETVFTFGGNYSNKLFLGLTFGFKSLRYVESSTYEESDPDTLIPYFKSLKFQQDLSTRGVGFEMKFGMIYKVNDLFRFGLAVSTPSWYSMHDEYKNSMVSNLDTGNIKSYTSESPDGSYDYNYKSPFKVITSAAFVFGKAGLLSVDYEFSDYSDARLDAGGSTFSDVNSYINRKYTSTHSIRIGTEWLYENISFRGGASLTTSPLVDKYKVSGYDFSKKSFSTGIGFKEGNMFFDLGYVYTFSNEFYQPYTLRYEDVPGVRLKNSTNNFVITVGVKF